MIKEIKAKIKSSWKFLKKQWKKIVLIIIGGSIVFAFNDSTTNEVSLDKITQKYKQATEIKTKYQLDGASLVKTNIKNDELDAYKGEPKDEIKITLGDKDKSEFVPNLELKRWNEVSFKIKTDELLKDVPTADRELEFADNKIKFKTPKMEFEMEDFDDSYKFIWSLNEDPRSTKTGNYKVEFGIESEGLEFYYQPPLTQEYQNGYSEEFQKEIVVTETQVKDLEGNVLVERPENVVGSYQIYHSTEGGLVNSEGKDYKTGKAFSISRPHIIDAEGKETWGILKIENGIYSVEIPQEFLDICRYPIKSNDNFGYESAGGSSEYIYNKLRGAVFTIPKSGTGNSLTASIHSVVQSGHTLKGKTAIYLHSNSSFQQGTEERSWTSAFSKQWVTFNFPTSPDLIQNTEYVLIGWSIYVWHLYSPTTLYLYYDAGGANQGHGQQLTYDGWPNPASFTHNNNVYSIYATYTPAGDGAAEPQMEVIIIGD